MVNIPSTKKGKQPANENHDQEIIETLQIAAITREVSNRSEALAAMWNGISASEELNGRLEIPFLYRAASLRSPCDRSDLQRFG